MLSGSWLLFEYDSFPNVAFQMFCHLFVWCSWFFGSEARTDLGKSTIDKEVVEKVSYHVPVHIHAHSVTSFHMLVLSYYNVHMTCYGSSISNLMYLREFDISILFSCFRSQHLVEFSSYTVCIRSRISDCFIVVNRSGIELPLA